MMDSNSNSSSGNSTEEFAGCPTDTLLLFANEYYTPLLCLFGAVGNCLSIYVFFTTASHRSLTSSYYLSALAASDTGFLLNVFAFWLATVQGMDVITTSVSCPIVMYSAQVMGFLSVWFVVAFTVERFFAVCYPLTRPTVCTVTRARRVITGLSLVAISLFSYVLFIAEVVQDTSHLQINNGTECSLDLNESSTIVANAMDSQESGIINTSRSESQANTIPMCVEEEPYFVCSVREKYHDFSQIANYLDTFFTLILPFCVISFLNFRITLCVWKLKGQRENIVALSKLNRAGGNSMCSGKSRVMVNVVNHDGPGGNDPNNAKNFSQMRNGTQQQHQQQRRIPRGMTNRNGRSTRGIGNSAASTSRAPYTTAEVRVTKTLLLVSTVFLVFNLPSHAIRVVIFIKHTLLGHPIGCAWLTAMEWANILFNTNFGVNFLLYCVSGRNFRKSLRNIFCHTSGVVDGRRRLPGVKPFLRCPYSRNSSKGKRKRNHHHHEERGGKQLLPDHELGSLGGCTRNPSIHSTTAFGSKNRESYFPTSVTEVETYA